MDPSVIVEHSRPNSDPPRNLQQCGPDCWIKASWNRPHKTLGAKTLHEHPPALDETMRDIATSLYKPIHFWQFRILEILPNDDINAPITCKLVVACMVHLEMVTLRDAGTEIRYEALSYSWGRPDFTVSIQCNDLKVPITRHLADALRHLRLSNNSRYLWTDAISINQYDLVEKGNQVQLMYTIFKRAERVIGWLGASTSNNYRTMSHIETASACHDDGYDEEEEDYPIRQTFREHKGDEECEETQRAISEGLSDLTSNNPWFGRAWILQEVFATKRLLFVCGSYTFGLRYLRYHPSRPDSRRFDLLVHGPTYIKKDRYNEFPNWVRAAFATTEGFQSSLDQDRIFALQNIAEGEKRSEERLFPTIDYSKSVSTVFQDWVKSILNSTGGMWPVCVFEDRSVPGRDDLPSWVPDLREKKHRALFASNLRKRTSQSPVACPQGLLEYGTLRFKGLRLMEINEAMFRTCKRPSRREQFFLETEFAAYCATGVERETSGMKEWPLMRTLRALNYVEIDIDLEWPSKFGATAYSVIGPPGLRPGDVIATFSPDTYLAYGLRPVGDSFRWLGPCLCSRFEAEPEAGYLPRWSIDPVSVLVYKDKYKVGFQSWDTQLSGRHTGDPYLADLSTEEFCII